MLLCSVNGITTTQVECVDRGLLFGDGVFTTAKIQKGNIVELNAHLNRLIIACQRLFITLPDMHWLQHYVEQQALAFELAVLKIIITSGLGNRGYARSKNAQPTVLVMVSEFPQHYANWQQQGISLGISAVTLGINPLLAGMKHLNRLEQVLIKQQAELATEDDMLVLNCAGQVIETSCANLFWWQNDCFFTPDLTQSGVDGVFRQKILRACPQAKIVTNSLADLNNIQAMFVCNSLMEIVPVKRFNHQLLDISMVHTFREQIQC